MKKSQENDEEQKWDKLLQIHTTGRDDSNSDQYRYPHEPTPYTDRKSVGRERVC